MRGNGHWQTSASLAATLVLLTACTVSSTRSTTATIVVTARPAASPTRPVTAEPVDAPSTATVPAPTPIPAVASLKATVAVDLLSCRYGPGPSYLFLYGLRRGANIVLIGRTDGENWHWVYVKGKSPCWVKTDFLDVHDEWLGLPVVYPGPAKLPVSPYYPPTTILYVAREQDRVTVEWLDIPLRAGDEEDSFMQHYIAEVWRCQDGRLLFEPLATNDTTVTFVDQAGCSNPSHGRVFVQEKHGFAGPTYIPWPAH